MPAPDVVRVASPDGTPIAAFREGRGPTLVLVHGTTADHTRWRPVLPALAERFTVHALDRRGRGASGDADRYDMAREFEDVAAFVDSLPAPVHVVAHSYGALCSLEAALRAKHLGKLVLYEPPIPAGVPIYPPGLQPRLDALLAAGDREGVVATFMREVVRVPPKELEMLRSLPAWQARVAAAHTIPRELRVHEAYRFDPARFRGLRAPTLLLQGGDSPPFLKAATEAVRAAVPGARVAVMPGQQHAAMDTAPQLFLREVLGFLA